MSRWPRPPSSSPRARAGPSRCSSVPSGMPRRRPPACAARRARWRPSRRSGGRSRARVRPRRRSITSWACSSTGSGTAIRPSTSVTGTSCVSGRSVGTIRSSSRSMGRSAWSVASCGPVDPSWSPMCMRIRNTAQRARTSRARSASRCVPATRSSASSISRAGRMLRRSTKATSTR